MRRASVLLFVFRGVRCSRSTQPVGTILVNKHVRLCLSRNLGPIIAASSSTYTIAVKTGDRKEAGTDANVHIVLHGPDGQRTAPTRLDNLFRDDFERGRTDTFTVEDSVDIRNISKIELWRDKMGLASEWFVDTIQVENSASPEDTFVFPIYRWVKDTYRYSIAHLDTFLPGDDPNPHQRHMEIADKRSNYELAPKVEGMTAQVGQRSRPYV